MRSIFLWILLLIIIIYITKSKMYEGYTKYEFVNYPGNDIAFHNPVTKGQCETLCSIPQNPRCVGYATDFISGSGPGKCWLKKKMKDVNSNVNTGTINTGIVSYIK